MALKQEELDLIAAGIEAMRQAKELNLTLIQYLLYGILGMRGPQTITSLQESSHIDRTTISKSIKKLVEVNLVNFFVDKKDLRKKMFYAIRKEEDEKS